MIDYSHGIAPHDMRNQDSRPSTPLPGRLGYPDLPPATTAGVARPLLPRSMADFAPGSVSPSAFVKLTGCRDLAIKLEWWPLLPLEPVSIETLVDAELITHDDMPCAPSPESLDDELWLDDEPVIGTVADVVAPIEPRQWSSSSKENVAPPPPTREPSAAPPTAIAKLGPPPSIGSGSTASLPREPGVFIFQDATPLSRHSSRTSEPHTTLQEIDVPPPRSVRNKLDAFVAMRAHGRLPEPTPATVVKAREPTPALSRSSDPIFPARPMIRVLASVELLQLPVFRYLGPAGFELVETPEVDGHLEPHLVVDGVSALIFVQTQYLPRRLDDLVARFAHFVPGTFDRLVLIVFGAAANPHLATNPAVVKALAQLTDAGIDHRVVGSAHEAADVAYAFAEHAQSVASIDEWTPWTEPDRPWLSSEVDEVR